MADETQNTETAVIAPEPLPAPAYAPVPEAEPKPKKRVKTRTLALGAVIVGVLGGVAGGYTIQYMRQPTPLPPLAVTQPRYPASPVFDGTRPAALPAKQDDATITEGDLTKLLLPTPKGATTGFVDHEWWTFADEASLCDDPGSCFTSNVSDGVVRIADTTWNRSDGLFVEIRIFQYRPGDSNNADREIGEFEPSDGEKAIPMPAGVASSGYEYYDDHKDNDDHAVAVHGDLAVYFWVTSKSHVPDPSVIDGLITQQMARL